MRPPFELVNMPGDHPNSCTIYGDITNVFQMRSFKFHKKYVYQ